MSSRSIGHARCRSADDGTHVRRYCIETADDVCVFPRPAESFGSPNPIRQFCYTFGWAGVYRGWRQMLYTAVRLLGVVTHSRQLVHAQLWEEEEEGSALFLIRNVNWPPPTGAPFPIFLLLFPENVGTRSRWWPAPKEKKKTTSSLELY